jgi:hypothetical protein
MKQKILRFIFASLKMIQVKTVYRPEVIAHVATLDPLTGGIKVVVHVDKYENVHELNELFLYNFDADNNCIEFAFGERMENVEAKKYISYSTDPAIHRPPFRIEIRHQLDTAHLEKYGFTISYSEL